MATASQQFEQCIGQKWIHRELKYNKYWNVVFNWSNINITIWPLNELSSMHSIAQFYSKNK